MDDNGIVFPLESGAYPIGQEDGLFLRKRSSHGFLSVVSDGQRRYLEPRIVLPRVRIC